MLMSPDQVTHHPLLQLLSDDISDRELRQSLRVVRQYLGMDVAFLSRFRDTDRVLEHVDSPPDCPLQQGQIIPLAEGYCLGVVNGELPELITDTSRLPAAQRIPATTSLPIGSHLSVPVQVEGRVYGTLCCLGFEPNDRLDERDIKMLRAFAEILALRLHEVEANRSAQRNIIEEIESALAQDAPRIVFQPVFRLPDLTLYGFECLSRFEVTPQRSPDQWFHRASTAGVGIKLEEHVLRKTFAYQRDFVAPLILNVNVSPELVTSGQLELLLQAAPDLSRITLEITEHAIVKDYTALANALTPLRLLGVKVAVDDAGAGYSSMRHILQLQPDIIKLDMSLTQHIHEDRSRRALARGLVNFAHEIGSQVVAEGVEAAEELVCLRDLQVDFAQGYHLARPMAAADALALIRTA